MAESTFAITLGSRDGYLQKLAPTYPPGGTAGVHTSASYVEMERSYGVRGYSLLVGLLRWDTSSLPDNAVISAAKLKINIQDREGSGSLSLRAEWYDPGTIGTGDWAEPVGNDAGSWAISSLVSSSNTLTLSSPTSVSRTGFTGLRLGISQLASDAPPTGQNRVTFIAQEGTTILIMGIDPVTGETYVIGSIGIDDHPKLIVTYTSPDPITYSLVGTVAAVSGATGDLTVASQTTHDLAGTAAAVGGGSGTLSIQGGVVLQGTAAAVSGASGALSVTSLIEPWINVWIDWNGDGDFMDANEHVTYEVLSVSINRGRANVNDDFGAGRATIELVNTDSLYSPFDTGSALDGQLVPGKTVRVFAVIAGISYPLFYGYTTDYAQSRMPDGRPTVIIGASDGFDLLRLRTVRLALQESQRVNQLIITALNAAAWDSTLESLDTGVVTVDEFWQHGATALEAIKEAAKQELGGQLFVDADGKITFKNRTARSSKALHATFTGVQALGMGLRREDLVSRVELTRAGLDVASAVTTLYTLSPTGRALQPGSTDPRNTIHGDFSVGGKAVVTPVASTDYTVNTQADGLGIDKTSSVLVESFITYGGGFSVTFVNQITSVLYLTLLQVRGQAVRRSNDERRISVDASSPLVANQVYSDSFDYYDNATNIRGYAKWLAAVLSQVKPRPVVEIIPISTQEYIDVLSADLGKKVRITNTTGQYPTNVNDYFFIEHIALDIQPGVLIKAIWTLFGQEQAGGAFFAIAPAGMTDANATSHLYGKVMAASATSGKRIKY